MVGITGHRDLVPADMAEAGPIRAAVRGHLERLADAHPSTPLLVVSGMAEGADQLVAEVALELGHDVVAALPKPPDAYERDFTTPGAVAALHTLLDRCLGVSVVEPVEGAGSPDTAAYVSLGLFLVRHARILLALWDGEPARGAGGTAHVVAMMRGEAALPGRLDLADGDTVGEVIHVPVRRSGGGRPERAVDTPSGSINHLGPSAPRVDWLNGEIRALYASEARSVNRAKSDLLGARGVDDPGIAGHLERFAALDVLATRHRRRSTRSLRLLVGAASAAGLAFLLYTDLFQWPMFLALYLTALTVALAVSWRCVRCFDVKNRHLDLRALAEATRVAVFWRLAGVKPRVSDVYLDVPAGELNWVRQVLRAWRLASSAHPARDALPDASTRELIQTRWMEAQRTYYRRSRSLRAGLASRADRFERIAMIGVLGVSASMAVWTLITMIRTRASFLDEVYAGASDWMQFVAGLLLVAIALIVGYGETQAWAEEALEFDRMAAVFDRVLRRSAAIEAGETVEQDASFTDLCELLGREALRENTEWLLLHRQRPLTADLG